MICSSKLHAVETKSPVPIYVMLAMSVDLTGRDAILIDGGNRANPYPLVSVCKQLGIDHEYILDRVHVSRAFTAHQLEAIICREADRVQRVTGAVAVGVIRPSALFGDDQLGDFEARCMLGRCVRALGTLAREQDMFAMVVDRPLPSAVRRRAKY